VEATILRILQHLNPYFAPGSKNVRFGAYSGEAMPIDEEKIDQAILALLYLTLSKDGWAWKGFDFRAMNRLHEKGFITDPVNKNKSVLLTDKGIAESQRLFELLFTKNG
jgi:hypothetical protein